MEVCHLNIVLICRLMRVLKNLPNEKILWVMKSFTKVSKEDESL